MSLLINFLLMWLITMSVMLVTWMVYLRTKNPGIVDVSWGIAIFSAGIFQFIRTGTYHPVALFYLGLVLLWMLRLSGYLYSTRIKIGEHDGRYINISKSWKRSHAFGFFWNYQLQALFSWIIATPFLFIVHLKTFSGFVIFGGILILFGLLLESLADWQLYQFKKQYKGQLCNKGLWQYTRHPNYFFEWLIWLGFSISVWNLPFGIFSIVSPILLLWIMLKLTIPITERYALERRGVQYKQYQRDTATFFPKC